MKSIGIALHFGLLPPRGVSDDEAINDGTYITSRLCDVSIRSPWKETLGNQSIYVATNAISERPLMNEIFVRNQLLMRQ
ncbi:hypothetical protein NDU88_008636 [Pleurodeles waltl]|uniref:Uncharacterized protein n=1 Tax=Pleurodeles waltl TaxID=8319 RepID=A0AAV7N5K1_PLEWA|nr:hypothetical protein NDU88_008636 [Pleurodeles waltl]